MLFKLMLCTETWESHPVGRNQKAYHLMVNLRFVIGFTMLKENTYRYSWHCKTILTRQTEGRYIWNTLGQLVWEGVMCTLSGRDCKFSWLCLKNWVVSKFLWQKALHVSIHVLLMLSLQQQFLCRCISSLLDLFNVAFQESSWNPKI
jgi:hypothetical protein